MTSHTTVCHHLSQMFQVTYHAFLPIGVYMTFAHRTLTYLCIVWDKIVGQNNSLVNKMLFPIDLNHRPTKIAICSKLQNRHKYISIISALILMTSSVVLDCFLFFPPI